jgi:hypothetical protein
MRDHLLRAHRVRALADALEREPIAPSGDRAVDVEVQALRAAAVAELRARAERLEARRR